MKLRSEKGFNGIDISISVVIIFIFVSIIAALIAQVNSKSKEISLKNDATYIAINEIEKVKSNGIEEYVGKSEADGNNVICENEEIENEEGFYRTITVLDYADVEKDEEIEKDIVKKVTVKISYMFRNEEQKVEFSTIVSKES